MDVDFQNFHPHISAALLFFAPRCVVPRQVEDVPLALCEFQGRLLAGVGQCLRLYDLGKRKLLRKAENRGLPTVITGIKVHGDRIYVSDLMESVRWCVGVGAKRDGSSSRFTGSVIQ